MILERQRAVCGPPAIALGKLNFENASGGINGCDRFVQGFWDRYTVGVFRGRGFLAKGILPVGRCLERTILSLPSLGRALSTCHGHTSHQLD